MQPHDLSLSFKLMCNASDYVVGVALGQKKKKVSPLSFITQLEFWIVPKWITLPSKNKYMS